MAARLAPENRNTDRLPRSFESVMTSGVVMSISKKIDNAKYLKISAPVRYWEDAEINGVEVKEDGSDVPFKNGGLWEPVIDIESGEIVDWPKGVEAFFHFKVVDAGNYFLLNSEKEVLLSIFENYVPSGLCHGDSGYGDYIIFRVDATGKIVNYQNKIDEDDWVEHDE